ncbi:MAG: ABC transporter permease subunit [Myxococcota bacterium]
MTTPPAPGLFAGIRVVYRMQLRRLIRGRKLRLGIISCTLVLLAIIAARYASERDVGADRATELAAQAITSGFEWGYFKLLAFLLPFLFTSSAIAEEVEGRTFAFLTVRPVGRMAITLGKFLAGTTLSLALILSSGLILHIAGYATEPTAMVEEFLSTAKVLGTLSLLVTTYSAMCVFWGALVPEAAGIVSGLYLAVIELLVSYLPSYFRCLSMNYLARQMVGYEPGGLMEESAPLVSGMIGGPVIVGVGLLFLFFAVITVQINEYRFSQA